MRKQSSVTPQNFPCVLYNKYKTIIAQIYFVRCLENILKIPYDCLHFTNYFGIHKYRKENGRRLHKCSETAADFFSSCYSYSPPEKIPPGKRPNPSCIFLCPTGEQAILQVSLWIPVLPFQVETWQKQCLKHADVVIILTPSECIQPSRCIQGNSLCVCHACVQQTLY